MEGCCLQMTAVQSACAGHRLAARGAQLAEGHMIALYSSPFLEYVYVDIQVFLF